MQETVLTKLKELPEILGLHQITGSRYGRNKLVVVAIYGVSCLMTLAWGLSSEDQHPGNALGAEVVPQRVSTSGERWYLIHNKSGDDWSRVQLTLNAHYSLQGPEEVKAGDSFQAHTRDFRYLLYVPRTPRDGSFEALHDTPSPGPFAPRDLEPLRLKIRADEGMFMREFEGGSPHKVQ